MIEIQINDTVKHDFDGTYGVVKDIITDDPNGYNYKVDWSVDNGLVRTMWMQRKVLIKVDSL